MIWEQYALNEIKVPNLTILVTSCGGKKIIEKVKEIFFSLFFYKKPKS